MALTPTPFFGEFVPLASRPRLPFGFCARSPARTALHSPRAREPTHGRLWRTRCGALPLAAAGGHGSTVASARARPREPHCTPRARRSLRGSFGLRQHVQQREQVGSHGGHRLRAHVDPEQDDGLAVQRSME